MCIHKNFNLPDACSKKMLGKGFLSSFQGNLVVSENISSAPRVCKHSFKSFLVTWSPNRQLVAMALDDCNCNVLGLSGWVGEFLSVGITTYQNKELINKYCYMY